MAAKVFISHKKEDAEQASIISAYLVASGLQVYLDVIDAQLGKSGPDLADYIRGHWRHERTRHSIRIIDTATE